MKMICPTCEEQGLKSRSEYYGTSITTMVAPSVYYDEEGNYHGHNPNCTTSQFRCSQGHKWQVEYYEECCSCDFNKDRTYKFPLT